MKTLIVLFICFALTRSLAAEVEYSSPTDLTPPRISFASKVQDWTHAVANDLRTVFSTAFLYATRTSFRHKRAKLKRKRDGQAVLSSEYCIIGGVKAGSNLAGGNNGNSPGNNTDSNGPHLEPTISPSYDPTASATLVSGAPEPSATAASPSSNWHLAEEHQGRDFFDGWDFFVGGDPTHGTVTYVPADVAFDAGLASVTDSSIFMRLETTQNVPDTRQSVRITTKTQYSNGALFMLDVVHMPTGCAVWPAWWTNGPRWPSTGEIDIIEGVGEYTNNQATIHTDPGCTLPTSNRAELNMTGSLVGGTDCSSANTGNQGCGVRARESNSFGAALNEIGGGVYAMVWTSEGIRIHFFPRGDIPSDIEDSAPDPDRWGRPMANWPATSCPPFEYFTQHSAIFDTTLCGDWAAAVWDSSGIPGQEESCAQRTGFSSCEEYVRQRGDSFHDAYWEVNWVRIYKQRSDS